ncbi:MAG TPA: extracellular solute-binding protein, partial [Chloroflexota bacterium]|nr:extracellular solute-binding protein [Chloroflexota bacterium]
MQRLSRRRALEAILLGSGAVVAGGLLAACGGVPGSPSATAASSAAAPTAAPAPATTPIPASQPASSTSSGAAAVVPASTPVVGDEGAPPPDLVAMPPKSPQPIQLRFHMRTGGDKSEPAIYVYRPDEWAKASGNTYKLEPIPGGQDYIPKIEALAASGTIGDVMFDSEVHSEHSQLVKFKVLEPSDSYMKTYKISKDEWFQAITDTLTYDGQFYGMPKTGHPGDSYIWVNLKMFKDAGLPEPPEYGVTFDQVREWANKLSKGSKDSRDVYGFYSGVSGIQPITNGVRQFGGDILNKDGTASTVDQQGFSDWLNWNHQLIVEDKVHPFSQAIPNGDFAAIFAAEKLAMVHNQRYLQFAIRNAVKDKFPFKSI